MAEVILENLVKTYHEKPAPEFTAVKEINLTVVDGEFMVLVGPSGCGKSTTLRMIAGLEEITAGRISIGGRVINDVLPKDRDIAMVFQNYALYPHMSVRENMSFGLRLQGMAKAEIEARVLEAAQLLGLEELLDRRPKALSGGQRQRVAVGRAIVRKPKVFLFDEPLSNLDAKMRTVMRAEISKLHARIGATMIYVTHDQVEAMTMGDRICVMKDGEIQQVDTPLNLYNQPANSYVAGFIGTPPMNLIRGRLDVGTAGTAVFTEDIKAGASEGALRVELPGGMAPAGAALLLGIRPENLHHEGGPGRVPLTATTELLETLGMESILHLRTGGHELIARIGPQVHLEPGERVTLHLDVNRVHLFDASDGHRL